MKKLTEQQTNEVCDLIMILASHMSDIGDNEGGLYCSVGYFGTVIEFLTKLIKYGYDTEMYTFEELTCSTYKRINRL